MTEFEQLKSRIVAHISIAKSEKRRRDISISWNGFIAAAAEYDEISPQEHLDLVNLLPRYEDDPVIEITLGTDSEVLVEWRKKFD